MRAPGTMLVMYRFQYSSRTMFRLGHRRGNARETEGNVKCYGRGVVMDNGSSGRLVNHEEGRGRGSRISRTAAGSSRGGVFASGPAAATSARSSARPSVARRGRAESTSPLFLRQTRSAAIFRRGVATVAVQRSAAGVTGFGVRTWRRFSKCRGKLVFFRNFSIYHRSESF